MIKGTVLGTKTDNRGNFAMENVDKDAVLIVTSVGYALQEVKVSGRTNIDIVLKKYAANMEEVRVISTGYQKVAKDRITGSMDLISGKEIQKRSQVNVLDRLEGQVAGLLVMNGKDNGADDAVTLRGVSTLYATKRPLIVVDNFPIEGDINSINPNDVASITVLKDAAAASIWGARAANGVIVITTKRARAGKFSYNYRNSFQFSPKPDLTKLHRLSSADDIRLQRTVMRKADYNSVSYYDDAINELYVAFFDSAYGRITPQQYADKVAQLSNLDNADQIKQYLMNTPFTQSHSISTSGGTETAQFYGSFLYNNTIGLNKREKNDLVSIFLKNNLQLTKRLNIGANVNYNISNSTDAPVKAIDIFGYKPYSMIADAQGNPLPIMTSGDPYNQNTSNVYSIALRNKYGLQDETYYPLKEINRRDITGRSNFMRIQAEAAYKITKGIEAKISYQVENDANLNTDFKYRDNAEVAKLVNDFVTPKRGPGGAVVVNADGTIASPIYNIPQGGIISENRTDLRANTFRAMLDINRELSAKGHIDAIVGTERSVIKYTGSNLTRHGYDPNSLQSIGIDEQRLKGNLDVLRKINANYYSPGNYYTYKQDNAVSFFGNAAYTYLQKYILSGSARVDATNMFGTDPKYLYKPAWSLGGTWILSKEAFMQKSPFEYLALRATYGINGNIPKNSGPFMLARAGTNYYNNLPYNTIYSPANDRLRWEPTYTTNIGVDFNVKGRIIGKADLYNRRSVDVLSDYAINPTYGFSTLLVNAGEISNKGFELQVETKNVLKKNFEWATSFVFAKNKNKVVKVTTPLQYSDAYARASANGQAYVAGYPYGSLFSFQFSGLDNKGQVKFINEKGDTTIGSYFGGEITDVAALVYSGSKRPVYTAALGNTIRYRNMELFFNFVYYGSYSLRRNIPTFSRLSVFNNSDVLKDSWMKPGDENITNIPSIITNSDYSSYWGMVYYKRYMDVNVFDASYIKLRDIIFTYNLPQKLFNKYITGAQFTAQARNVYTWTKNKFDYDPESFEGGRPGVPVTPTYIFGVNVNF